jgi:hypothetical protein
MRNILQLSLLLCFSGLHARVDTISVQTASVKKAIDLKITGAGGYQGKSIKMVLKSLRDDSFFVHVEAGRRLDSKDSSEQDILVIKDEFILMTSKKQTTIDVTGYCCQAHNHAPSLGSVFYPGQLADENLYKLAQYLKMANLSSGSIQNAIWCISDNNELSSVVDDGTEPVNKLRRFLSKLKNIEVPWYNIFYKKTPGSLFSGTPERITGNVDYYISDLAHVVANIRDDAGGIVFTKDIGKSINRGQYTYNLEWYPKDLPKGNYTLRLYENSRELKKLGIVLK